MLRALSAAFLWLSIAALTSPVAASADRAAGIAVIIGNSAYGSPDTPDVSFAIRDADAVRAFLIRSAGFRPANIIDLRDAALSEMQSALGNERSHRGRLFRRIVPGQSDIVVFYSGHGVPDPQSKSPYLLPVDVAPQDALISGYPLSLLYRNLARSGARSVLVLLDACFSGSSHAGTLMGAASPAYIAKTPTVPAPITVLSATGPGQVASWDTRRRHGLFTAHLLDAAKGMADRKAQGGNGDGQVTLSEVKLYLDKTMTPEARRHHQREQRASLAGDGATVLTRLAGTGSGVGASMELIEAPYLARQDVRVRVAADIEAPVLSTLRAGATVWVAGQTGPWYRVQPDDGPAGYVLARHLQPADQGGLDSLIGKIRRIVPIGQPPASDDRTPAPRRDRDVARAPPDYSGLWVGRVNGAEGLCADIVLERVSVVGRAASVTLYHQLSGRLVLGARIDPNGEFSARESDPMFETRITGSFRPARGDLRADIALLGCAINWTLARK